MRALPIAALASLAAATALAAPAAKLSPAAEHGRALFVDKGCYECHGYVGQGSIMTGPALAPNPISVAGVRKEVRTPRANMPPFSPAILSDAELDDIYAYLQSIPVGRGPDQISLLAAAAPPPPAAGDAKHGQAVYAANCAGCHGSDLQGAAIGPALRGEGALRSAQGVVDFIKAPPPIMPKLYPGTLSAQDVQDVAAYIRAR